MHEATKPRTIADRHLVFSRRKVDFMLIFMHHFHEVYVFNAIWTRNIIETSLTAFINTDSKLKKKKNKEHGNKWNYLTLHCVSLIFIWTDFHYFISFLSRSPYPSPQFNFFFFFQLEYEKWSKAKMKIAKNDSFFFHCSFSLSLCLRQIKMSCKNEEKKCRARRFARTGWKAEQKKIETDSH